VFADLKTLRTTDLDFLWLIKQIFSNVIIQISAVFLYLLRFKAPFRAKQHTKYDNLRHTDKKYSYIYDILNIWLHPCHLLTSPWLGITDPDTLWRQDLDFRWRHAICRHLLNTVCVRNESAVVAWFHIQIFRQISGIKFWNKIKWCSLISLIFSVSELLFSYLRRL
jgi:hypothetical protein